MMLLKETLGSSSTTNWFKVGPIRDGFTVEMLSGGGSGFNGGTITMQTRTGGTQGAGATAHSYTIDGSVESWTAADKRRYLDGNAEFRFSSDGNINDVDIYVQGESIII
jgi:hypothetical protein